MKLKNKLLIGIGAIALVAVVAVVAVVATLAATQQQVHTYFGATYTAENVAIRLRAKSYKSSLTGDFADHTAFDNNGAAGYSLVTDALYSTGAPFSSGTKNADYVYSSLAQGAKDLLYVEFNAIDEENSQAVSQKSLNISSYDYDTNGATTITNIQYPYVILVHEITNLSNDVTAYGTFAYNYVDSNETATYSKSDIAAQNIEVYNAVIIVPTRPTDSTDSNYSTDSFNYNQFIMAITGDNSITPVDHTTKYWLEHNTPNDLLAPIAAVNYFSSTTNYSLMDFFTTSVYAQNDQYTTQANVTVPAGGAVYVYTMLKVIDTNNGATIGGYVDFQFTNSNV